MPEREKFEAEIGIEDIETPVNYEIVEIEGKKEVVMEVGRPRDPPRLYLDEKQIDKFIDLLKTAKEKLMEVI